MKVYSPCDHDIAFNCHGPRYVLAANGVSELPTDAGLRALRKYRHLGVCQVSGDDRRDVGLVATAEATYTDYLQRRGRALGVLPPETSESVQIRKALEGRGIVVPSRDRKVKAEAKGEGA
jgi:hypothetical protein